MDGFLNMQIHLDFRSKWIFSFGWMDFLICKLWYDIIWQLFFEGFPLKSTGCLPERSDKSCMQEVFLMNNQLVRNRKWVVWPWRDGGGVLCELTQQERCCECGGHATRTQHDGIVQHHLSAGDRSKRCSRHGCQEADSSSLHLGGGQRSGQVIENAGPPNPPHLWMSGWYNPFWDPSRNLIRRHLPSAFPFWLADQMGGPLVAAGFYAAT